MEEKKTHRLVSKPQMSVRFLADYMAASDQARRTIVRGCKFRTIARLLQHDEAKLVVAKYILSGVNDPELLIAQAEYIKNKLATEQFDIDCNQINADFVARFAKVAETVELPKEAQTEAAKAFPAQMINGVKVAFSPSILLRRITKKNIIKSGAMMLRYKKGTKLASEVASYQSSAIHGMLCLYGVEEGAEVDGSLCLTLDAHTGEAHPAPTNAVTRFNNMKAACATIADAWDNVQPPKGAII